MVDGKFVKYGNSEIIKHPYGVCTDCGMPLEESEADRKLCDDCRIQGK